MIQQKHLSLELVAVKVITATFPLSYLYCELNSLALCVVILLFLLLLGFVLALALAGLSFSYIFAKKPWHNVANRLLPSLLLSVWA